MRLPEEYANLPLFKALDPNAVQRTHLLPAQLSDKSAQEQEEQESALT